MRQFNKCFVAQIASPKYSSQLRRYSAPVSHGGDAPVSTPSRAPPRDILTPILGSASPQQQEYLRQKAEQRERQQLHRQQLERDRANLVNSIKVLHEDYDYAFLYKPPGMPNTGGEKGGNFQDYVEKKYGGTRYQPKLLMSLDKIQGGICVVSKHFAAERHYEMVAKKEQVQELSLALVSGVPKPLKGKIKGGAIRNAKNHTRYSLVSRNGTPVESNFLTLAREGKSRAVVCFNNLTNHRHQIRLCCSALGTPIVGDKLYEPKSKPKVTGLLTSENSEAEKVPEFEVPFVSCYVSFPKYISQDRYEVYFSPSPSRHWNAELLAQFTMDDAKALLLLNDSLKEVYIR